MSDGTPMPPPPRPTPITVAAVLLLVAGWGCLLAGVALDQGASDYPFFIYSGAGCCWVLVKRGRRLLAATANAVDVLGAMMGVLSLLFMAVLLPIILFVSMEIGWPTVTRDHFAYGGLLMWLNCGVAVFVACFILIRHAHEYESWRGAEASWEAETAWEYVEGE